MRDSYRLGYHAVVLAALVTWLREHGVTTVIVKSTAQYWWPVWLEWEGQFASYLAQARFHADPHGRKTLWGDARFV